ncbi:MAG: hypothetical protein ACRED8_10800, partial [Caulobacteraceae bacterium]
MTKINVARRHGLDRKGQGRARIMTWARILAPLCGGESDRRTLDAAAIVAEAFDAELACVHA